MIIGLKFLPKNLRNVNIHRLHIYFRARLTDALVPFREGMVRRAFQNANKPLLSQTHGRLMVQDENNCFLKIQTDILFLANAESENYFNNFFNFA